MKPKTAKHPACGKSWPNRDSHSHCPACHETFGNHTIADAHRRTVDGERICLDPAGLTVSGYTPALRDGLWISGKPNPRAAQNTR